MIDTSKESKTRIAILNEDRCKPKKCKLECKKICPINKAGKLCIEVESTDKMTKIAENLCIGCGLCVKKCPFDAIRIINLPKDMEKDTSHRYGQNTFKLHRLPYPQLGQVLGLVGTNGIGKTTALQILSGREKPNLGKYSNPPDWNDILKHFKGSELYNYFKKYLDDELTVAIKIQHVDVIPKIANGTVMALLTKKDKHDRKEGFIEKLDLTNLTERTVETLSGGELQRFAIAFACCQKTEVYMFDEPTSYLDVKQRLKAGDAIRSLSNFDNYIIVVEHDLSILDYLSDSICVLYGVPAAYGVVTLPYGVREGINVFLDGFIPTENMRFRDFSLSFKITDNTDIVGNSKDHMYKYPAMSKTLGSFKLNVEGGSFTNCEIIVLLGENGTGKTTLIRLLTGDKKCLPDSVEGEVRRLLLNTFLIHSKLQKFTNFFIFLKL